MNSREADSLARSACALAVQAGRLARGALSARLLDLETPGGGWFRPAKRRADVALARAGEAFTRAARAVLALGCLRWDVWGQSAVRQVARAEFHLREAGKTLGVAETVARRPTWDEG